MDATGPWGGRLAEGDEGDERSELAVDSARSAATEFFAGLARSVSERLSLR